MKPFVKWAGGKEKEYKFFKKYLPKKINNYVEPFVGGGAVFFALSDEKISGKKYINDFSSELYKLYCYIRRQDEEFLSELHSIDSNIELMKIYSNETFEIFNRMYQKHLKDQNYDNEKTLIINRLFHNRKRLVEHLDVYDNVFEKEVLRCLKIKVQKAVKLKNDGSEMNSTNLRKIYHTALMMSLYNTIRYAYNNIQNNNSYKIAYFLFIREYCYSSMFRYNPDGKFNVPYGGMSYNSKSFKRVIEYVESNKLVDYLKHSVIKNKDFEDFMKDIKLTKNDFVFVDPPYDTEFSEYAMNEFDRDDQKRLAILLSRTKANIMVVIKNTRFIYNLYKEKGFFIKKFDKKYSVNFQNRNDREVEHLIITNYRMDGKENV